MKQSLLDWMPEKFGTAKQNYIKCLYNNDTYISLITAYELKDDWTKNLKICNTFNLKTGDIIYLEDILEADEELVMMLLTRDDLLMSDFSVFGNNESGRFEYMKYFEPDDILENLMK